MKMNKKIIVSTLALAMGAALAGSVSGTVAWFQYSTRAQAAFIGASAHCSEALEIKANSVGAEPSESGFTTELTAAQVAAATSITAGTAIEPITYGTTLAADGALTASNFKKNPIYQHFGYSEWIDATSANYYQFELNFRVKDIDGSSSSYLSKKLYLTNLDIVSLTSADVKDDDNDLYKAIRVHISCGSTNLLFCKDGTTNATSETVLGAKLDLNNDGYLDKTPSYEWDPAGTVTAYGDASLKQTANNIGGYTFANDSNPSAITGSELGTISATATGGLKVTVTMWIEGWSVLGTAQSGNAANPGEETSYEKLWDPATYIGEHFGVGFRFACEAHAAH